MFSKLGPLKWRVCASYMYLYRFIVLQSLGSWPFSMMFPAVHTGMIDVMKCESNGGVGGGVGRGFTMINQLPC